MLSQFSVKNFKSIKNEVTLDMQATSNSEHPEHLIMVNKEKYLPLSVIYGPNGAGKSNVIEAIVAFLSKIGIPIRAILQDGESNQTHVKAKPFKLSEDTLNCPTEFEIYFTTLDSEYRYNLHVKEEDVVFESLDRKKFSTNRISHLFERKNKEIKLFGEFSKLKISEDISSTLPLLSYLAITYKENKIVQELIRWLLSNITLLNFGNPIQEMMIRIPKDEKIKNTFLKLLNNLNIDIADYRVEEQNGKIKEIYTKHIVNGYENELTLREESQGTGKLFSLLPYIINSLEVGQTLIIDELDAKLHPKILEYIINLFSNPEINKKGAQLIFTSHDLYTMNSSVFRRDEIWFVAKGKDQGSILYSLAEFKQGGKSIRKDASYDKDYVLGKYGADPYLERILDWDGLNG